LLVTTTHPIGCGLCLGVWAAGNVDLLGLDHIETLVGNPLQLLHALEVADLALLVVDCLEAVEALGTELCAGICRGDVVDELLCLASVVRVWADTVSDTIGTGKDCVSNRACVDCRCCVEKKKERKHFDGVDANHLGGINESGELDGEDSL
jgi:hypothetical protein